MRVDRWPDKQYNTGLFSLFVNDPENCYCNIEVFDKPNGICIWLDNNGNISEVKPNKNNNIEMPLMNVKITENTIMNALRYALPYIEEVKIAPNEFNMVIELNGYNLYMPSPEFFGAIAYNLSNRVGFWFMVEHICKIKIDK